MHEMQEKFILNPENIIYLKFFFILSFIWYFILQGKYLHAGWWVNKKLLSVLESPVLMETWQLHTDLDSAINIISNPSIYPSSSQPIWSNQNLYLKIITKGGGGVLK